MSGVKNKQKLGAFKIDKAMDRLYQAAANHLSREDLEMLEQASELAKIHAENLSTVLHSLGSVIEFDEGKHWDHKCATPRLLWLLSHQLDTIAGMIDVSENAEHRLGKLKQGVNYD